MYRIGQRVRKRGGLGETFNSMCKAFCDYYIASHQVSYEARGEVTIFWQ
jgi:hypothetical protein